MQGKGTTKDYRMSLSIAFVLKLKEIKGPTEMVYGHLFILLSL